MKQTVESIKPRLERWNDFVDKGNGSFLFRVNFPLPEWGAKLPPAPHLWPGKVSERIERQWAEYELMCRKAELVNDDRIPFLSNVTGTEIFAEAFGCAGCPRVSPGFHAILWQPCRAQSRRLASGRAAGQYAIRVS